MASLASMPATIAFLLATLVTPVSPLAPAQRQSRSPFSLALSPCRVRLLSPLPLRDSQARPPWVSLHPATSPAQSVSRAAACRQRRPVLPRLYPGTDRPASCSPI